MHLEDVFYSFKHGNMHLFFLFFCTPLHLQGILLRSEAEGFCMFSGFYEHLKNCLFSNRLNLNLGRFVHIRKYFFFFYSSILLSLSLKGLIACELDFSWEFVYRITEWFCGRTHTWKKACLDVFDFSLACSFFLI